MKREIKKVADLTQKQYEAALARYGMVLDRNTSAEFDVVSEFGFQLMGKTRRAKLAHAIDCKDEYDESQIRHEEEAAATDAARREQDRVMAQDPAVEPVPAVAKKGELQAAVAERFEALKAEKGDEVAGTLLQEAIKACGQKIYVDGKVGPYSIRLANRIPEADLLAALNSRAQIGAPTPEAK